MLLSDFIDSVEKIARETKEHVTRRRPRDISPFAVPVRADAPLAVVTINQHHPEVIMEVASICAVGFEADLLGIAFETYQGVLDPNDPQRRSINPLTGQEWEAGQMQEAAEKHDGVGQGWVLEAVCVAAANRAGDVAWRNLPYRYVGGKHLSWQEEQINFSERGGQWVPHSGMTQMLSQIMLSPTMGQQLPQVLKVLPDDFPASLEERDLATASLLAKRGHAPLIYTQEGSPMVETLKRHGDFIDPTQN